MINFSVVIPVYNKANEIASTLKSVLEQSYSAAEIILINDGSTDESEKIILDFNHSKIKYFKQENQGAAAARNFGIQQASNEYIALLDADDLWDKDYLNSMASIIKEHPSEHVFACAINLENKKKDIVPSNYSIENMEEISIQNYFEASYKQTLISSSSVVIHKDVFKKVGYFDTKILSGQDTDYWIRLGIHCPVVFLPEYLVTYRYSPTSLFRSGVAIEDKLNPDKFKEEEKQNSALKKFLDLNRYSLALYAKNEGNLAYYNKYTQELNPKNINFKQRLLLNSPIWVFKMFRNIQVFLDRFGIHISSF